MPLRRANSSEHNTLNDDHIHPDVGYDDDDADQADNATNGAESTYINNRPDNNGVPKVKRTACVLCRKRKLRCDGGRPSCGTCARLGHDCKYDEIRKKSGPKRGYVKALEARLGWSPVRKSTMAGP